MSHSLLLYNIPKRLEFTYPPPQPAFLFARDVIMDSP